MWKNKNWTVVYFVTRRTSLRRNTRKRKKRTKTRRKRKKVKTKPARMDHRLRKRRRRKRKQKNQSLTMTLKHFLEMQAEIMKPYSMECIIALFCGLYVHIICFCMYGLLFVHVSFVCTCISCLYMYHLWYMVVSFVHNFHILISYLCLLLFMSLLSMSLPLVK